LDCSVFDTVVFGFSRIDIVRIGFEI
jgi:hypothetical protein